MINKNLLSTAQVLILVILTFSLDVRIAKGQSQWTTSANGTNINNTNSGNVGIGTTSPGEKLVTVGNFLTGNITTRTQLYGTFDSQFPVVMELGYGTATSSITPMPVFTISKNLASTSNPIGLITFANSNIPNGSEKRLGGISTFTDGALNSGSMLFYTTSAGTFSERMRVTSVGNVGIGTSNPTKKLHVFGANSQVFLDRPANSAGNYALVNFATNGIQKFFVGMNADSDPGVDKLSFFDSVFSPTVPVMTITGGNVGVGTTSPTTKFHVTGEIRSSIGGFRFPDGSLQTSGVTGIFRNVANSSGTAQFSATSLTDSIRFAGQGGTVIHFDPASKKITIDATASTGLAANIAAGSFGLNTGGGNYTFPGNVTVTGTINAGTINAKYQDVAEWVSSTERLSAGTVVVLDTEQINQVVSSKHSYDMRVAGVVSDQPGIVLGEGGDGRLMVATTGRIRVKVDARKAPIRIGDLLVTSQSPGLAMRSEPVKVGKRSIHQPGTLIGKALEPLNKGTGEILVLLSLQ